MKHSIKNGLFIFILSIITAGLFVMANPVDYIFAIEGDEKNTDMESPTIHHLLIVIIKQVVVH